MLRLLAYLPLMVCPNLYAVSGKKFAWQGVALLPFVDETRIRDGLAPVYHTLSSAEKTRNERGKPTALSPINPKVGDFCCL